MSFADNIKLGDRLRAARATAGLTQEEAAKQLDMARTTMVAIERGDREIRPDELVALASLYNLSVGSLLRPSAVHVDLVGQFRRNLKRGDAPSEQLKSLQMLQRLATSYVELEHRLGQQQSFDYPPVTPIGRGGLERQAEDLAQEVRVRFGLGLAPIADIQTFAELEMGLRVFVRPLPSDVSGVFAYTPELGACVLLNRNHPPTRRSTTLAHEIAHLLTSREEATVDTEHGRKPPTERFADYFAAAFLMPGTAVRRAFSDHERAASRFSPRHLILMAVKFHVSIEAMCRRLEQLDLLPAGTYDKLRSRGLNAAFVRDVLGRDYPTENERPPARQAILAAEAYARGLLSEEQVAELLAVDRVEVRRILDALTDDLDLEPDRDG